MEGNENVGVGGRGIDRGNSPDPDLVRQRA